MTERHFQVRRAQPDDAAALGEFIASSWGDAGPDAPGFAGATDDVIQELADSATMRAIIDATDRTVWVATERERLVGFAASRRQGDETVELAGIVVAADTGGHGVGTMLVEQVVEAARRAGAGRMVVRTEPDNERAIGFYRARGFVPRGTVVETVGGRELVVTQLEAEIDPS